MTDAFITRGLHYESMVAWVAAVKFFSLFSLLNYKPVISSWAWKNYNLKATNYTKKWNIYIYTYI